MSEATKIYRMHPAQAGGDRITAAAPQRMEQPPAERIYAPATPPHHSAPTPQQAAYMSPQMGAMFGDPAEQPHQQQHGVAQAPQGYGAPQAGGYHGDPAEMPNRAAYMTPQVGHSYAEPPVQPAPQPEPRAYAPQPQAPRHRDRIEYHAPQEVHDAPAPEAQQPEPHYSEAVAPAQPYAQPAYPQAAPQPDYAAAPQPSFVEPVTAPQPDPQVAREPAPQAAPQPTAQPAPAPQAAAFVPHDFGIEKEHPMFPIPFSAYIDGQDFTGENISVTQMVVRAQGGTTLAVGSRHVACVYIRYANFGISLEPEVVVLQASRDGQVVLQFADPTGDHLPQLRYLINSYIAGDVVSLNGMLAYTGPTAPKAPKPEKTKAETKAERVRSIATLAGCAVLAMVAAVVVFTRYTTGHEMHPVFVDRAGQQLRATVGGQIGYLNPQAVQGEVVFAVNSNSGDVLNFVMPCDCDIAWQPGVDAGSTVLPSDLVATVFAGDEGLNVNTMISVQGLSRAMRGDKLWLDFPDGQSVRVQAVPSASTRAATLSGDMFLPITLRATDPDALTAANIGQSARLRITPNLLDRIGFN